jgi:hypothetical protein
MKSRAAALLFFVFFSSFAHSQIANPSGVMQLSAALQPASPHVWGDYQTSVNNTSVQEAMAATEMAM